MYVKVAMKNCKVVTTNTGVFTFHEEQVPRGVAKRKCNEEGGILAPVTNYQDSQALMKAFDPENCPFHRFLISYHIGLDLYSYDNELVKVFSNNVLWNNTVHESLYYDKTKSYYDQWKSYSKCPEAFLDIAVSTNKPLIIQAGNNICDRKRRYVCLKSASNCVSASALVKEYSSDSYQVNLIAFGGMIVFSVVVLIGLIMFHLKSLKNRSMASRKDEENPTVDVCKSCLSD